MRHKIPAVRTLALVVHIHPDRLYRQRWPHRLYRPIYHIAIADTAGPLQRGRPTAVEEAKEDPDDQTEDEKSEEKARGGGDVDSAGDTDHLTVITTGRRQDVIAV